MNKTKKATVVAKTATRKVRLSASEVAFAKSQEFPLSEVAKEKLPKRGRPVGSKNAAKKLVGLGGKGPVDWEQLAKKLQTALALEMKTNEGLQALFESFKEKIVLDTSVPVWRRLKFLFTGRL